MCREGSLKPRGLDGLGGVGHQPDMHRGLPLWQLQSRRRVVRLVREGLS